MNTPHQSTGVVGRLLNQPEFSLQMPEVLLLSLLWYRHWALFSWGEAEV